MGNSNGKMLISLLTGVAIGTGLGILFAPNKGSDTRKKIKKTATDSTQDVSDWLKHAKKELVNTAHDQKESFDKRIEDAVSNMSHKVENILNGMEHKLEEIKKKNAHLQR